MWSLRDRPAFGSDSPTMRRRCANDAAPLLRRPGIGVCAGWRMWTGRPRRNECRWIAEAVEPQSAPDRPWGDERRTRPYDDGSAGIRADERPRRRKCAGHRVIGSVMVPGLRLAMGRIAGKQRWAAGWRRPPAHGHRRRRSRVSQRGVRACRDGAPCAARTSPSGMPDAMSALVLGSPPVGRARAPIGLASLRPAPRPRRDARGSRAGSRCGRRRRTGTRRRDRRGRRRRDRLDRRAGPAACTAARRRSRFPAPP